MFDNAMKQLLISLIIAGEAEAGIPGTPIKSAFQPTNQGANSAPTAYLFKIGDKASGYPYRVDKWDRVNSVLVHQEIQQLETTWQMSALVTEDPDNLTQLTASDLLNSVRYIMQSTNFLAALQSYDIGILRVDSVRNPYFTNDKDRHQADPSFDFVMTHKQIVQSSQPVLQSNELKIFSV